MKGKYFEGVMSLSDSKIERGHVKTSDLDLPVIIQGTKALKQSKDKDQVVIELLPVVQWQKIHSQFKLQSDPSDLSSTKQTDAPVVILDADSPSAPGMMKADEQFGEVSSPDTEQ